GWELRRSLSPLGSIVSPSRAELSLSDSDSIRSSVNAVRPHLIVNAAAYTAVDRAESDYEAALQANGTAPGVLAEEARRIGAALIHYSTDYVFNGLAVTPYKEDDPVDPVNAYGRSKLAGEQAIASAADAYLILRTSWVYGPRGHNFLLTMLRLGGERPELRIVADQVGSPTSSRVLGDLTALVVSRMLASDPRSFVDRLRERRGLYNATCSGQVSWHGFAQKIFELRGAGPAPALVPITSGEYPTPARRPAYSVLSTGKLAEVFQLNPPDWEIALTRVMEELNPS
ncbi:MAG TPA: dTDP-4-dehydrorhamnose reductase, partial [Terriglobales bacterium]|nr:dTDP-4-dehydrorhamnose reductase [Terriglobales bacterium]